MKIKLLLLFLLLFSSACARQIPKDAFKLSPASMEDRKRQSRVFETHDEISLISAGISVLQDLGYNLEETEKEAGLVTASKLADASDTGQKVGLFLLAVLGNNPNAMNLADKEQRIKVSLVTKKSLENDDKYIARISFQRVITNNLNQVNSVETIKEDVLYKTFFEKLSKSVFLEAHEI